MSMPEILPPEILTAAEAAWGRAQEGQVHTGKNIGSTAIFGTLDGAVREAREESEIGFGALEVIANPEIKELFKRDFKDYKAIFAKAGIDVPTPDELAQGGIDFSWLAELKRMWPGYDLVVAPLTLPQDTFERIGCDWSMEGGVVSNWNGIMKDTVDNWRLTAVGDNKWTAFMLFNNEEPEECGLSYDQITQYGSAVPVVCYAAYQVHRIRQGILPVDTDTRSWAAGRFVVGNDTYAPCVGWEIGPRDYMLVVDYCNASKGTEIVGLRSLMGDIAPARSG